MKRNVAHSRGRISPFIVLNTSVALDAAAARICAKETMW